MDETNNNDSHGDPAVPDIPDTERDIAENIKDYWKHLNSGAE